jgi:hypothetical protein
MERGTFGFSNLMEVLEEGGLCCQIILLKYRAFTVAA